MLLLILKSSVCLAAFMLFYKLLLEKTSTHNFKRFYLIGIILISIGIPFITFTAYIEVQSQTFDIPVLEDYPIPEHIDNIETLETIVPTKSFQDYVPSICYSFF